MRLALAIIVVLLAGCGPLLDGNYGGPPLARISATGHGDGALLWNLSAPKGGSRYVVTAQEPSLRFRPGANGVVDIDIYADMPGADEFGYAYVAQFDVPPGTQQVDLDGASFIDPATLVAVDTQHVLVFARSQGAPSPSGIVWPRNLVIDNPAALLGPGYHLAAVRCGSDGLPQQPMHVALVDTPLDRDDARPRFDITSSSALAMRSDAVNGIPSGPVGHSCLVLP